MTLGFGLFRRHLIPLLTIALAVLVWPSLERTKLEDVGFGHSQPWQSDQSTNAVIEIQAEIDSADDFASNGGKVGLASYGAYALLAAPARLIPADGLPPSAKHLALLPNKTGPPTA